MKQKTGIVGLYSGRQIKIKANVGGKLTLSQTAKQAAQAITKKYGTVEDRVKYMHKGKGNWVRYSLKNDKKRTGNVTTDLKKWRRQPNKYDYKGIDTKESGKTQTTTKSKPKISSSVGRIKNVGNYQVEQKNLTCAI